MPLQMKSKHNSVVLNGSFFANHSLSMVNRELVLSLLKRKDVQDRFDISLDTITSEYYTPELDESFKILSGKMTAAEHPNITVRHRWPPDFSSPRSGLLVINQPWEYGALPKAWIEPVKSRVDEVWAYTRFVKDTYMRAGISEDKVFVVPAGINPSRFYPTMPRPKRSTHPLLSSINEDTTLYLFVGGTIARKGADALLNAWAAAFTPQDNVALLIKDFGTSSFYANQGLKPQIEELQAVGNVATILYTDSELTDSEITDLYAACDCLVHPFRGEGYGLPIAEAMACGKPVICTEFGAPLDFTSASTVYYVPARRTAHTVCSISNTETMGFPFWGDPSVEALIEQMRYVNNHRAEAAATGLRAAECMHSHHTWDHAAAIAAGRLLELSDRTESKSVTNIPISLGIENISLDDFVKEDYAERVASGVQMLRRAEWKKGFDTLETCLKENPDDPEVISALAIACFRRGEKVRALSLLHEGVIKSPNSRDIHHNLAFCLMDDGKFEESLKHALIALKISPDNKDVQRMVERAHDGVLQLSRRLLRQAPSNRRKEVRRSAEYTRLMALYNEAEEILTKQNTPSRPRISLCMIAKNEEHFLRNCLQSVQGLVDEIVLVDTGSTDKTVQIAEEFGAKIVHFEWTDNFAEARNVSLKHATGDWGLWLDADEEIDPSSLTVFREEVDMAPANVGAFMVSICNWLSTTERVPDGEKAFHHAARLFRLTPDVTFTGRIHEQNLGSILAKGYSCMHNENLKIDHFGYAAEVMSARNKHDRFLRMLHREVEECPEEWLKAFQLFNLGNAYFTKGDMENAAKYFSQAAVSAISSEEYTTLLYVEWATALHRIERAEDGLEVCCKADELGLVHSGIEFSRGFCHLHLGQYEEGEVAFRRALHLGSGGSGFIQKSGDIGIGTFKANFGLAMALTAQEKYEEALEQCALALEGQPNWHEPLYMGTVCKKHLGREDETISDLKKVLELVPNHLEARLSLAELLVKNEQYNEAISHLQILDDADPSVPVVVASLATCYENTKQWSRALDAIERLGDLTDPNAEVCVNRGRILAAMNQTVEALDSYTEAIMIDPSYANSYFNAGDLLYSIGEYGRAVELYVAGLERQPNHETGYFVLGNSLFQIRQYEAAAEAYRQQLRVNPNHSASAHNLEMIAGMKQEAVDSV